RKKHPRSQPNPCLAPGPGGMRSKTTISPARNRNITCSGHENAPLPGRAPSLRLIAARAVSAVALCLLPLLAGAGMAAHGGQVGVDVHCLGPRAFGLV